MQKDKFPKFLYTFLIVMNALGKKYYQVCEFQKLDPSVNNWKIYKLKCYINTDTVSLNY